MIAAGALILASCGGAEKPEATEAKDAGEVAKVEEKVESVVYNVDVAASSLEWTGGKITGDEHTGTVALKSGSLTSEGGNLIAGDFVIDMTSMANTDLAEDQGNAKLVGHLSGTDFFNVEEHPTSSFAITGVEAVTGEEGVTHHVSGNLTIMGVAKEIKIPANVTMEDSKIMASAMFTINRTDWGVKYGSGSFFDNLGDNVINDDISYKLNLVAAK